MNRWMKGPSNQNQFVFLLFLGTGLRCSVGLPLPCVSCVYVDGGVVLKPHVLTSTVSTPLGAACEYKYPLAGFELCISLP